MPYYILIVILVLLNTNLGYSQYEKRKQSVDKIALDKIAKQKTEALKEDIVLSQIQYTRIKKIYKAEVVKIDSLKFLSPDFYEDPMRSRAIILDIKHNSEERILELLSIEQKRTLQQKREAKRKKAFDNLQQENKKHELNKQ